MRNKLILIILPISLITFILSLMINRSGYFIFENRNFTDLNAVFYQKDTKQLNSPGAAFAKSSDFLNDSFPLLVEFQSLNSDIKYKLDLFNFIFKKYSYKNYFYTDNGYFLSKIEVPNEQTIKFPAMKGYHYHEVAERINIPFYVYNVQRPEYTNLVRPNIRNEYDNFKHDFIVNLGPKIKYKEFNFDSIKDFEKYFHRIDFHLNELGAYKAYSDIIKLISEDFDVGKPREIDNIETIKNNYMTSSNDVTKYIKEFDDIYKITLKDSKGYELKYLLQQFHDNLAKIIDQSQALYPNFLNFELVYSHPTSERIYETFQADKPNLLILGDSFAIAPFPMIAQNFNKTFLVDTRSYQNFMIEDYIKENKIDAVLVLQHANYIYFSDFFYLNLK